MVPNTTLLARTTMSSGYNGTFGPNSTFLVPTYMSQEEFFALQMTNGSDANTTLSNDTTVNLVLKTWYPSGYSPAHIIIASVVVTVLMIMVVVGNMLVIIAIVTEKALKNIQNWFIASLAVSDFFLGLVIMPFSLANELMGYWIFGFWWCEIHSAMDVLLCTASIMNLCLISLDRYWSITQIVYKNSRVEKCWEYLVPQPAVAIFRGNVFDFQPALTSGDLWLGFLGQNNKMC
uniref:SFRICE_039472 n=1 Tax=Spodoptera frugiperda TaxID=7108 RepID=A0A2H1WSF9_SPOFR